MSRYISIVSLIFLIVASCSSTVGKPKSLNDLSVDLKVDTTLNSISDSAFYDLICHFQITTLPFYFGLDSPHDRKFDSISLYSSDYVYEHCRLPIDTAIKYFFDGNKKLNKQPSGGIYEHYYGYRLPSNGDYVLVFYFRQPSVDEYPYRLASFDYNGKLIDHLGVSGWLGQFDPEAQRECIINADWTINIEELSNIDHLTAKKVPDSDEYQFNVKRIDFVYQITEEGRFKLVKTDDLGSCTYIDRDLEGNGWKFIAPEGVSSLFK